MDTEQCSSPHPPVAARNHLASLTALRFFAALHVVLYHEAQQLIRSASGQRFAANGFIGVSMFYVLSGFILAYTYLEPRGSIEIDKGRFWRARLARVYPVYLLALVVALPIFLPWAAGKLARPGVFEPAKAIVTALANISLLQAWLPQTVAPWNSPGWSLSVEAFFYCVFPYLAVRLARRRNVVLARYAALAWILGLLPAVGFLSVHPELWSGAHPDFESGGLLFLKFLPLEHLPEFIIGIAFGLLFLRRREEGRPALGHPGAVSVATTAVLVVLLTAPAQIPYPLLHSGVLAPLFGVLILALASERGPIAAVLRHPLLVFLGKASYAIYLLHEPLAAILYKRAWSPLRGTDAQLRFVIFLFVVTAISAAVLHWYEEPARRLIRRSQARRELSRRELATNAPMGRVGAESSL